MNWATRATIVRGIVNTHYKIQGLALQLANSFGFLYPGEVFLIQAIAKSLGARPVVVCIGAGAGTGSLAIAEVQPEAELFTIDISEGGPHGGFSNERNAFEYAGLKVPTQILGSSQVVHADWPRYSGNRQIDLLFVDGDHAETALQGDIDGWLPYVRLGGYVLYHDYNSVMWGAVTGIVDRNMNNRNWSRILEVDTLVAFRREVAE